MSRSFILAVRFVLIAILLCLLAYNAKAGELTKPNFVSCGLTNGMLKSPRLCAKVQFSQKNYLIMFSHDGTTIIAVMRLYDDGKTKTVYITKELSSV